MANNYDLENIFTYMEYNNLTALRILSLLLFIVSHFIVNSYFDISYFLAG